MPTATGTAPEIAVIVAAYRRRQYLDTALDSVLAQTIDPARIELLVVTDFADPALDARLAAVGGRHRVDPEPVIGRWLLGAIDATRAPLVAIVDDDDRLEPDRLERALEVFVQRPATNLYRNRVTVIDAQGAVLPLARYSRLERAPGLDRHGPIEVAPDRKEEGIREIRASGGEWLNISTMVFRREIFGPSIRPLVEASICQDLFTFAAAATAPGGLYFDARRTTQYRHYPTSASRRRDWKRRHWEDHLRFATYARDHGPVVLAEWLHEKSELLGRVVEAGDALAPVRAGAGSTEARSQARAYLRRIAAEPTFEPPFLVRWGSGAIAASYCVVPRLTRGLLGRLDRSVDTP